MTRAQDVLQARMAAEVESVRARLAAHLHRSCREDAELRKELERTNAELLDALREADPYVGLEMKGCGSRADMAAPTGSSSRGRLP
jgi:hypothetical protein